MVQFCVIDRKAIFGKALGWVLQARILWHTSIRGLWRSFHFPAPVNFALTNIIRILPCVTEIHRSFQFWTETQNVKCKWNRFLKENGCRESVTASIFVSWIGKILTAITWCRFSFAITWLYWMKRKSLYTEYILQPVYVYRLWLVIEQCDGVVSSRRFLSTNWYQTRDFLPSRQNYSSPFAAVAAGVIQDLPNVTVAIDRTS